MRAAAGSAALAAARRRSARRESCIMNPKVAPRPRVAGRRNNDERRPTPARPPLVSTRLNAERLQNSELLSKQPLCSLAQITKRFRFAAVELAVRHGSDGRVFNHLPGRPGDGVGIEPQIQLSCCDESKIAQVGANAR